MKTTEACSASSAKLKPQTINKRLCLFVCMALLIALGTFKTTVFANSICPKDLEKSVTFHPNPVVDVLHIQSEYTISRVMIHSLSGQLFVQQRGNVKSIDVSALPKGTFVVRIIFENDLMLSRVIVK